MIAEAARFPELAQRFYEAGPKRGLAQLVGDRLAVPDGFDAALAGLLTADGSRGAVTHAARVASGVQALVTGERKTMPSGQPPWPGPYVPRVIRRLAEKEVASWQHVDASQLRAPVIESKAELTQEPTRVSLPTGALAFE